MDAVDGRFNPFPGLRPFEADEDRLFFGRERQTDDLLRRLRSTRFLAVIGTSGCGKSSLVRCGLIPALQGGFMVSAGSSWRVATMHPGEDPIQQLAAALRRPGVLGAADGAAAAAYDALLTVTLRRGARGVVDAVRQARLPSDENVLLIVDQFEELFRFRRSRPRAESRDEAIAFVKLLLEAVGQSALPVYVVLTMRSDFLGDCMEYPGLPEAVNRGQYLVPRMSRDELRLAITGPVAVGGGTIAPRLVQRLLNEFGDDPDQLPVLQHALMRTWDRWQGSAQAEAPIDVDAYEAIGTMSRALSEHAEEAYAEVAARHGGRLAERLFKALTDTFADPRGVRRPAALRELIAVSGGSEDEVRDIVEAFRRPGRSFLTPVSAVPLEGDSIVDLSHESLMRRWERLMAWTKEETAAAAFYMRLSQAAAWFEEGAAGLWRNPELELAARWRTDARPAAAWASRYDDGFERAMRFLDRSQEAWNEWQRAQEGDRRRQLRRTRIAASLFATLSIAAILLAASALRANQLAKQNLEYAEQAVDASLAAAGADLGRPVDADSEDLQAFTRSLLSKAAQFYTKFQPQVGGEEDERAMSRRDLDLGDIYRMMGSVPQAVDAYGRAIAGFQKLSGIDDQEKLASAYMWRGETLRAGPAAGWPGAERDDTRALTLFGALKQEWPDQPRYAQEVARALNNRGIVRQKLEKYGDAERDFRGAIALLEPVQDAKLDPPPRLDLARAQNDLGVQLWRGGERDEARSALQAAVELGTQVVEADSPSNPARRGDQLELAQFENNLAGLVPAGDQVADRIHPAADALGHLGELGRPAKPIGVEAMKAHFLAAEVLALSSPPEMLDEYRSSVESLELLGPTLQGLDVVALRYWWKRLLLDLARESRRHEDLAPLLERAVKASVDAATRLAAASGIDAPTLAGMEGDLNDVVKSAPPAEVPRLAPLLHGLEARASRP